MIIHSFSHVYYSIKYICFQWEPDSEIFLIRGHPQYCQKGEGKMPPDSLWGQKTVNKKITVYTCPSRSIDFWTLFFEPVSYSITLTAYSRIGTSVLSVGLRSVKINERKYNYRYPYYVPPKTTYRYNYNGTKLYQRHSN